MGGGGSKTTSSSSVPKYLKPYVLDIASRAKEASNKVSDQPFTGQFYAPAQQGEFDAAQMVQNVGRSLGTETGQNVMNLGQAQARGDFLRPESNPYLQSNLDILRNEGMRNYADYRKGVTSNSIASGAYGGDRGQFAQAQLAHDTESQIQDAQSSMLLQNYAAERQLQQNSAQMIQQGAGLNLLGAEVLGQGGQQQRSLEQIAMDEQMAKFNEANAAPNRPLQEYANLIYGGAGTAMNQVQRNSGGGSTTGDIIGALLGAGSIGSLFA